MCKLFFIFWYLSQTFPSHQKNYKSLTYIYKKNISINFTFGFFSFFFWQFFRNCWKKFSLHKNHETFFLLFCPNYCGFFTLFYIHKAFFFSYFCTKFYFIFIYVPELKILCYFNANQMKIWMKMNRKRAHRVSIGACLVSLKWEM